MRNVKNYKKHIDDFFRERLGKYREVPPAEAWDELSVRLQTLKPYVPRSPYRWLWHVGMVSVITVFTVSLVKKVHRSSHDEIRVAATTSPVQAAAPQALNTANDAQVMQGMQMPASTANENIGDNNTNNNNTNTNAITANAVASTGKGSGMGRKSPASAAYSASHRYVNTIVSNDQAVGSNPAKNVANGGAAVAETSTLAGNPATAMAKPMAANAEVKENAVVKKAETPKSSQALIKKEDVAANTAKRNAFRVGFGVKSGYEYGLADGAARKFVVAPYAQLQLSNKLSVMVQPAAKYAMVSDRMLSSNTYYKVTNGSQPAQLTGYTTETRPVVSGPEKTYFLSRYRYTQTYDSMVKTRHTGGSYIEFELPVMLQYGIGGGVSVYGGAYLAISRTTGVTEQTVTKSITRTADTIIENEGALYAGPAPDLTQKISHYGAPLSDYTTPSWVNQAETRFRVGYIAGLSYQYNRRWMVDALIQQSPLKPDVKEGYNVLVPLSSAYFRLSVGYKLK